MEFSPEGAKVIVVTTGYGDMTETSLSVLASRVESGDTLAFGGKTLHRGPVAFARELARQDVTDLGHVGLAKAVEVDLLCGTGQLDRLDFGYVGFEALGLAPNFRRRAEAGDLDVREGSCYTVATSLRAAEKGVSFLPVAGLGGSDLPSVNDAFRRVDGPFDADEPWAVRRVTPDVAVVHATAADTEGNVRFEGADLTEGLIVRAADTVLVTAERVLEPDAFADGRTDIPGFLVDGVAEVPYGAHPCSCPGAYDYDAGHLRTYLEHARSGRIDDYVAECVGATEADYREAAVAGREAEIEWRVGDAPGGWAAEAVGDANGGGDEEPRVTVAEAMCVAIARRLRDHRAVFQGFASPLPTAALRLARERYEDVTHLSASGAVNGEPARLPVSTEDQHLLEGGVGQFTSPEAFDLAASGGVDVMFVGGAQFDRQGRMNGSVVGDYDAPKVRFGGAGGSGSLFPLVHNAFGWRTEHSPRVLPEQVDFVTASGNLSYLVTPLCEFEPRDGELQVVSLLPGVDRETVAEQTGWDVSFDDAQELEPPTETELAALERVDPTRVRRSGFDPDLLDPIPARI
jgi:acyl CoA:acetate/3-ketoacid CoA transferase alpha subunit/acyl CoA:acetate/3-ketoacid CoA transferase beta subunit